MLGIRVCGLGRFGERSGSLRGALWKHSYR